MPSTKKKEAPAESPAAEGDELDQILQPFGRKPGAGDEKLPMLDDRQVDEDEGRG